MVRIVTTESVGVDCGLFCLAEDGYDVVDGDDVKIVVGVELDGNGVLGIEQDAVVLANGKVLVVLDLSGDGDDASGDGRDFDRVGMVNSMDSREFTRAVDARSWHWI